jgi:hypothetical protein
MNTKIFALSLALPLIAPAAAHAAALMSAQDLLTACSGDAVAKATCNGYLMAATDLVLRREGHGQANRKLCVPASITVDQVRDAVLNLGQDGRAAHAPVGLSLVAAAMRHAWPCEGSRGGPESPGGPPLEGAPRDQ